MDFLGELISKSVYNLVPLDGLQGECWALTEVQYVLY